MELQHQDHEKEMFQHDIGERCQRNWDLSLEFLAFVMLYRRKCPEGTEWANSIVSQCHREGGYEVALAVHVDSATAADVLDAAVALLWKDEIDLVPKSSQLQQDISEKCVY